MNLLLIEPHELASDGRVRLVDRRAVHLRKVLAVEVGREIRAGVVGGGIGRARVEAVDPDGVSLCFEPDDPIDTSQGLHRQGQALSLVLAMPRPPVMGRLFEAIASFGVERLDLVNSWRVEKSFFSSRVLEPSAVRRHLVLGAEQGMTTRLPKVDLHPRLLPFLDGLSDAADAASPLRLLAHPDAPTAIDEAIREAGDEGGETDAVQLAIGPEGGWIDREVASFEERGFVPVSLGPWVLRVETAVSVAIGQLALVQRRRRRNRPDSP